jgi:hypothetical protein
MILINMGNNDNSLLLTYLRWMTIALSFLQWSNWTLRLSPTTLVEGKTGQFDTLLDPGAELCLHSCDIGGKRLDVIQTPANTNNECKE